jgi:hypothetical protein
MSKTRNRGDDFDPSEIFHDPDLDPESFVEAMEDKRSAQRSWKRVEELRDAKILRAQLEDWDDWEDD